MTQLDLIDLMNSPRPVERVRPEVLKEQMPNRRVGFIGIGKSVQSGQHYPQRAGWKDTTTSQDAANVIEDSGRAASLRAQCLQNLESPMTPKELAARIDEEITSIRPRLTELMLNKLVSRTGQRRDGQHVLVASNK